MFNPSRGGVRGGHDKFSWDSVKTDKDRQNYIGNSINAPVGRWQLGKDLFWYAKSHSERKDLALGSTLQATSIKKSHSRYADEVALIKSKEQEYMTNVLLHGFGGAGSTPPAGTIGMHAIVLKYIKIYTGAPGSLFLYALMCLCICTFVL